MFLRLFLLQSAFKMRFIFLLFLFFQMFCLSAGQTKISGGIKGFEGKTLKVYLYDDYISKSLRLLAQTKIENGGFQLDIPLQNTEQLVLKVEDKQTSFFAESDKSYQIGLSFDPKANQGRAYDAFLNIHFILPNPNGINTQIKSFNERYEQFFKYHARDLAIKTAGPAIENFVNTEEKKIPEYGSSFTRNYVQYALANLEDIGRKSPEKLKEEYLDNRPILYRNKEYINFFTQYYEGDFDELSLQKKGLALLKYLMAADREASIKEIQKLKNIKTEQEAELYLLIGLFQVYHKKRVEQQRILSLFQKIENKGYTEGNKTIAKNLHQLLAIYQKDKELPPLNISDFDGNAFEAKKYLGKKIYLNFWASWSIPSLREMQIIQKQYKEYGDKIHFISINLDENKADAEKWIKNANFSWTQLYAGDDYELRETFGIQTVPSYYLINEKGKIESPLTIGPAAMDRKLHELFYRAK